MNGYEFYKIYHPLNLHFTSKSYDIFKYNGKSRANNVSTFEGRPDKAIFEGWASITTSKETIGKMCIANFVYGDNDWIHKDKKTALELYKKCESTKSNFKSIFKNDVSTIKSFMSNGNVKYEFAQFISKTKSGKPAPLLQLVMANSICIESVCVIDSQCSGFIDSWSSDYSIDPLLDHITNKLKKYKPFTTNLTQKVTIDKELIQK